GGLGGLVTGVDGGAGLARVHGGVRHALVALTTFAAAEQPEAHHQRHPAELAGARRSDGADRCATKRAGALLDADVTMTAMTDEHGQDDTPAAEPRSSGGFCGRLVERHPPVDQLVGPDWPAGAHLLDQPGDPRLGDLDRALAFASLGILPLADDPKQAVVERDALRGRDRLDPLAHAHPIHLD